MEVKQKYNQKNLKFLCILYVGLHKSVTAHLVLLGKIVKEVKVQKIKNGNKFVPNKINTNTIK